MKKNMILSGFVFLITCVLVCLSVFMYQKRHKDYVKAQTEIAEYQQKLMEDIENAKTSASNLGMVPEDVQKKVTGCDRQRVQKDDAAMESLLSAALTWDSESTYDAGRELLMKQTDLTEESRLMTTFFPSKFVYDTAGNAYNSWDGAWKRDGLNMTYEGLRSQVVGIQDDVYSYIAFVSVSSSTEFVPNQADAWTNSSVGKCVLFYKTDASGNITGVDGYILQES